MRTSSRGAVDPFIVMDVMEAARAEEARGRSIIHMEVGQPGTPAPGRRARGARRRHGRRAAWLYRRARSAGAPRADRPALPRLVRRRPRPGRASSSPPAHRRPSSSPSPASSSAATGWRIGDPGYPSYRNILKALDLVPVGIETRLEHRYQPVPDRSDGRSRRRARREPGEPDGDRCCRRPSSRR